MTVRGAIRVAVAALLCALALPATASAADYVVNTTADGADGECVADCTLREAVNLANPLVDRVILPAGTYQLQTPGAIVLAGDTIVGAGARDTIIRGNGVGRVITANGGANGEADAISGVTITNGAGGNGDGGGVAVNQSATLTNVHVIANRADNGAGMVVENGSNVTITGSTIAGNVAESSGAQGGGIYAEPETDVTLVNSTVSGNRAVPTDLDSAAGGGIYVNGYTLVLRNSTVASNTAPSGNGGGVYNGGSVDMTFVNSILADNVGEACAATPLAGSHHNLVTDSSCGLTGPGNLQGISAGLGPLANHGGPTDTRSLLAGSPAINAGSGCELADQRGVTRPQHGFCDIGAFEYRASVLTVTTTVVNDHGFDDVASDFSVRVRANGADVGGSPAPGSAGTTYTLPPGAYLVSADPRRGYTFAAGGACAADGTVTLAEGQSATCTLVANDPSPTPGQEVNALPARGTVRVKLAGRKWRRLREGEQLPKGTSVDSLKGRVTLLAAGGQEMTFYAGIFKITSQGKGARPLTTLTLTEKLSCPRGRGAIAAAKKKKRRLWGDGRGRFRTKGKHSAATVVGTKYLVEDRCTSTLTRVVRGRVKVRDFDKRKTVTLRKGKRYVARAG